MPTAPEVTLDLLTARLLAARPTLDPRCHIARPDVVDIELANQVAAARYVEPLAMRCTVPRTAMRGAGNAAATAVSELLMGEAFDLFDIDGDWALGRSAADRYTGWVLASALAEPGAAPNHRITSRVAPVFAAADIKAPVLAELPFGALAAGSVRGAFLAIEGGGHIHTLHIAPLPADPLALARLFIGAPYLWGGRTPDGVDCSGLVQAALAACGIAAPRDSDQQRDQLGVPIDYERRGRGDIIFFPGHVGILSDAHTLLHANAHWMATLEEPLVDVIARLVAAKVEQPVTGVRRIKF